MTRLTPEQIAQARQLAERAADCAMRYYHDDYHIETKDDNSPVTQADLAVSALLEEHLPNIADFPVLSEENQPSTAQWQNWETYWLIDPIDGTKHFIKRTGDFCVCIALIHRNEVIFGLIAAPVTQEIWLAQSASHSGKSPILEKYTAGEAVAFPPNDHSDTVASIVTLSAASVSEHMRALLAVLPPYDWYSRGSALKYIDIVEGKATLYPKMWDTCEWDSAAGQCILACAGGAVVRFDNGKALRYGLSASLINPHFLAYRGLSAEKVSALLDSYAALPPR